MLHGWLNVLRVCSSRGERGLEQVQILIEFSACGLR